MLAEIARILAGEQISIASVHQYEGDEPINVVVVTHTVSEAALKRALAEIGRLESVLAPPIWIRMKEDLYEIAAVPIDAGPAATITPRARA